MRKRVQSSVADAAEKDAEQRVVPQITAQDDHVGETTDEIFRFPEDTACDRNACQDVVLGRIAAAAAPETPLVQS